MDLFVTILVFFGVIVLAAVVFAGWTLVVIVRCVFNLLGALRRLIFGAVPGRALPGKRVRLRACTNPQCRCGNPSEARFCRRCGSPMPAVTRVIARRAAVL